jgi:hypothetical protein
MTFSLYLGFSSAFWTRQATPSCYALQPTTSANTFDTILVARSEPLNRAYAFRTFAPFSVIEQYQGKQAVMRLLSAEDPNVRYHALLAVQKLMVHNWEYLGKQLEQPEKNEAVAAS